MARMKRAYERDVASGNLAPGARFLDSALAVRSGSGMAMQVNDAAESVHGLARSDAGKAVGSAASSVLGGDPAKLVASGATVTQSVAQAVDQTDAGRKAEYARSKRVYARSSARRSEAIEALHRENIQKGDTLTEEQQAQRSQTVRGAWRAVAGNLGKGLRTSALAKATGNSGELLDESAMKHTVGKKTDLAEGEVAEESDIVSGSTYGDLKRKLTKGNSQKLSTDRKATLAQLESHQKALEDQAWREKALRGIGAADTSESVDDPEDSYSFIDEQEKSRTHTAGIDELKKTAKAKLKERKKGGTFGIGSKQVLHPEEQSQYDAAKTEYDAATSDAIALREAHLKKHTDAYNALHERTTGATKRAFGFSNELTEAETQKKKYHHAEMTRLMTPHTVENLKGYMSESQLASATQHGRTMKNLESVRDTGLDLQQHADMAKHERELAEIKHRKTTGLSRSDEAELEQTKRRIALVYDSQREHNEGIEENLGKAAGAEGRFGGVDRSDNVDPSTYKSTWFGRLATGGVSAAGGMRTGARILGGKDKDSRAALEARKFGEAGLTGAMGVIHEAGGMAAQALGSPIDTKDAVKPIQGVLHGGAEVLEGALGPEAEREAQRKVQREYTTGVRHEDALTTPVNWMGSTDHGQASKDYSGMFQGGLSELDETLSDASSTYEAGKEHLQDAVSSRIDDAGESLQSVAAPLTEALAPSIDMPQLKAPELPDLPAMTALEQIPKPEAFSLETPSLQGLSLPSVLTPPALDLPTVEAPKIEASDMPEIEQLPDLPSAETMEVPELTTPELKAPELDAPELDAPEVDAPEVDAPEVDAPEVDASTDEAPALVSPEEESGDSHETNETDELKDAGEDGDGSGEDGDGSGEDDEEDEEDEWWSEGKEKDDDIPEPKPAEVAPSAARPALDLAGIRRAGGKSALLHSVVGDRAHREGVPLETKDGGSASQVQPLGSALRSQIQAAGTWSSKNHEGDMPSTPAVSDQTKREYNSWGSRFGRFSRNLTLRAGNAYRQSGFMGGVRSVGRSLWSGVRSLFGGKARNYDDPIENRQREEQEQARRRKS